MHFQWQGHLTCMHNYNGCWSVSFWVVSPSDSNWHHVAVTWASLGGHWAIYVDGSVRRSGFDFMSGYFIRGAGALVLGQEQDSLAGSFAQTQAFVGNLSQVRPACWTIPFFLMEIFSLCPFCCLP